MGILNELITYSNAVINDKIIACKKHKWACLRFLKDVDRRGKWRWDFDELRAEKYFKWMRLFKHSKGALAGQTKEPCDYELFVYSNIYGWIDGKTEARRFRRTYEQLARKQAKSQDKAIQALYEISRFGEPRAEVYIAATKKPQTMFIWGEADWLYRNTIFGKDFADKFETKYGKIIHKASGGFIESMSQDDKKTGDGQNPQFGVIDEYHLQDTTEYYDLLTSGMKTRPNPLLSIITTAGFELNNPCYTVEYKYVSEILDPNSPIENDRYFAIICEAERNETSETIIAPDGREIEPGGLIDEIGTDEAIMKSNPVTGNCPVTRENIIIETDEARDKPEKMRDVLTKTYNIWIQSRPEGYIDMTHWTNCKVKNEELLDIIKRKAGGVCYIGIDLSTSIDLTSVGFIFPYKEDGVYKYALYSHSFIPLAKYNEKIGASDKVPYDVWKRNKHVTVTDGSVVDYEFVLQYISNTIEEKGWLPKEYCFDPDNATWMNNRLESEGKVVVHVRQGPRTLSAPTKAFRDTMYLGRLVHDGNPLLNWSMNNAVVRVDQLQNILLDKVRSKCRIDPVGALLNAFYRAMLVQEPVEEEKEVTWGVMFG
ncbi:MAG: terminase large subunit [Chitinispirillia bacterium]|nr:terminase large subunit [Chitinispirillia bacterium]